MSNQDEHNINMYPPGMYGIPTPPGMMPPAPPGNDSNSNDMLYCLCCNLISHLFFSMKLMKEWYLLLLAWLLLE